MVKQKFYTLFSKYFGKTLGELVIQYKGDAEKICDLIKFRVSPGYKIQRDKMLMQVGEFISKYNFDRYNNCTGIPTADAVCPHKPEGLYSEQDKCPACKFENIE